MNRCVILNIGLPVVASTAEARFFCGDAAVSCYRTLAAVFSELGVCGGKAVAACAFAVIAAADGAARRS